MNYYDRLTTLMLAEAGIKRKRRVLASLQKQSRAEFESGEPYTDKTRELHAKKRLADRKLQRAELESGTRRSTIGLPEPERQEAHQRLHRYHHVGSPSNIR